MNKKLQATQHTQIKHKKENQTKQTEDQQDENMPNKSKSGKMSLKTQLSLFFTRKLLLEMGLALNIPSETPLEEMNFFLFKEY